MSVADSTESRDGLFEADIHATLSEAYAVAGDTDVSTCHLPFPSNEVGGPVVAGGTSVVLA